MLFNLNFANNTILLCFLFIYLIINLYVFIPVVIAQIFSPITELVIPIRIPIKEAKVKIEINPVIVDAKTKKNVQWNSELRKHFSAFYSLIPFALFLQLNNSFFCLNFLI